MEGKNRKVNCKIKFSLGVKQIVNQGTIAILGLYKSIQTIKYHMEGNGLTIRLLNDRAFCTNLSLKNSSSPFTQTPLSEPYCFRIFPYNYFKYFVEVGMMKMVGKTTQFLTWLRDYF